MNDVEYAALYQLYVSQKPFDDSDIDTFQLLKILSSVSTDDILDLIEENQDELKPVASINIPQFSNANDVFKVLRIIIDSELPDLTYEQIGYFLCPPNAKPGARVKYGENHYKLAVQFGLTSEKKPFSVTNLGLAVFLTESENVQHDIKKKLTLRIPVIQQGLIRAHHSIVDMTELMGEYLAPSTVVRRRSNMRGLLTDLSDIAGVKVQQRLSRLIWG